MQNESKITSFLEEDFSINLTRRQVYWLRDKCRKGIERAEQRMNCINAKPATRSAGFQEYLFLSELQQRLYGMEPEADEYLAIEQARAAQKQAERYERDIERMKAEKQRFINLAKQLQDA